MPLTVGIKNATEKGFAPNEIELLHSFEMGALAMVAGIGRINPDIENAPDRYNNIGVDEATERFSVAMHACGYVGCAAGRYQPDEDEELTEWQQELQASERLLFDVLRTVTSYSAWLTTTGHATWVTLHMRSSSSPS